MNKYKAKKATRTVDKRTYNFDSIAEAKYFDGLIVLLKKRKITELKLQPKYIIANAYSINTTKTKSGKSKVGELKYTPDFEYIDQDGKKVVIEVKGFADTAYIIRKKLFIVCAYKKYGVNTFIEAFANKEIIYRCDTISTYKKE